MVLRYVAYMLLIRQDYQAEEKSPEMQDLLPQPGNET
jgi:hypothetical protein